jgi:hypothetical protein
LPANTLAPTIAAESPRPSGGHDEERRRNQSREETNAVADAVRDFLSERRLAIVFETVNMDALERPSTTVRFDHTAQGATTRESTLPRQGLDGPDEHAL